MKTLDQIAIECQTDRATVFSRTWGKPHGYAPHYDKAFSHLRDHPVKLLEIGVGGGEGIRMWLEYFSKGDIYGVDSVYGTNDYDTDGKVKRYCFHQGVQGDPEMWVRVIDDVGGNFDIIIDDGSHINTDIIVSFIALWQHVKPGGFYAIEDLNTAYDVTGYFVKPNLPNHMYFIKGKLDEVNRGCDIDSIYFSKELAIFRKAIT